MNNFVVISGCSGGGKSTLLAEMQRRGHAIVPEPGRRIIEEELAGSGDSLPWVDMAKFAKRAIELAIKDREEAPATSGWVFFDRGLIDAASAFDHVTSQSVADILCRQHRYHPRAFFTPPWAEIYRTDASRRHDMTEALAEYERLLSAYCAFGYTIEILPKLAVYQRADWLIERLA